MESDRARSPLFLSLVLFPLGMLSLCASWGPHGSSVGMGGQSSPRPFRPIFCFAPRPLPSVPCSFLRWKLTWCPVSVLVPRAPVPTGKRAHCHGGHGRHCVWASAGPWGCAASQTRCRGPREGLRTTSPGQTELGFVPPSLQTAPHNTASCLDHGFPGENRNFPRQPHCFSFCFLAKTQNNGKLHRSAHT